MAMTTGTVTISGGGVASGSGMARAIYDAYITSALDDLPDGSSSSAQLAVKNAIAKLANSLAAGLVPYITTNAKADNPGGTDWNII